jgi:hypothetical protein
MEYAEYLSYISNVASLIAFLFANYQFFQWRKQQRHSLEIESIVNMEIAFEILIMANLKLAAAIDAGKKNVSRANDMSPEEKKNLEKWINDIYFKQLKREQIYANQCVESYETAYFKVKCLGLCGDDVNEFSCKKITEEFDSLIKSNSSLENISIEAIKMKTAAKKKFSIIKRI